MEDGWVRMEARSRRLRRQLCPARWLVHVCPLCRERPGVETNLSTFLDRVGLRWQRASDYHWPALDGDEVVLRESAITFPGGRWRRIGRLRLTDQRVIWRETRHPLLRSRIPLFKSIDGEARISEIGSVRCGSMWVFEGGRVELRMRSGTSWRCYTKDREGWVTSIQNAVTARVGE
jgi:hypothetical protein